MVLGLAIVKSLENIRERISNVREPEILMIPSAPPEAVARAQIVSLFILLKGCDGITTYETVEFFSC
jgi:hypothetical protein